MVDRQLLLQPDLRPLPPRIGAEDLSLRDWLSQVMTRGAEKLGISTPSAQAIGNVGYGAGAVGEGIRDVKAQDVLPVASEASSMRQAVKDFTGGNYLSGGINLAGAIPFAGEGVNLLKQAGKTALKDVGKDVTKSILEQAAAKPLTKKAAEALEREQRGNILRQTAERRKFGPGENRQPFINPTPAELEAIRAEHGEGGILRQKGDLGNYVDPSQADIFPPAQPRTREQKPLERVETPEGGTSERMQSMLQNPAVRARIKEAAEEGRGVQSWYDTTPLQKAFTDEFGEEEGMKRFSDFIGMVASTSTGQKIGQNIKIGSNYYSQKYGGGRRAAEEPYIRKQDIEMYGAPSYEVPPEGYGADKQQTHMFNVNQFETQGGLSSLDNPKIAAFYENLMGNWEPTTVDKHAVRLGAMATRDPRWLTEQGQANLKAGMSMDDLLKQPTNWTDIPGKTGAEYGQMEQMWNSIAKEMGISPAELQAMAWVGGGKQTGLGSPGITFMDAFKDRIRRTAIRDNIPPAQVLKKMMRGELTLAMLQPDGGGSAIG
jgi:hypothetical protein